MAHDWYTEIDIPQELQDILDAADTVLRQDVPSTPFKLKQTSPTQTPEIYEYRQGPGDCTRQNAAEQLVKELEPLITKWPGRIKPRIHWQFKDLLVEKGVLVTPADSKNIYIPRPLPSGQEGTVAVAKKEPKSQASVKWDKSKAYVLDPATCIFTLPDGNKAFRTWLVTIRYTEENMEKKD